MLPPRIGFIGLGIMGSAMAQNLVKAGWDVEVYNRDRKKTGEFQKMGLEAAPTCKELALRRNVIITMVTGDEAMRDITENPDGVFAAKTAGLTLINMSTNSVRYTKELSARCYREAVRFISCPVSGSKSLAENAQLILLAGGDKRDVEKNEKILLSMGKSLVYAGIPENAAALKLCVNLIVAHLNAALCESVVFAETLKLDPELIFRVLEESPALNCGYFFLKKENVLNETYPPAFALKDMLKDARYMLAEVRAGGLKLPAVEAIEKIMAEARAGSGDMDLTVIKNFLKTAR